MTLGKNPRTKKGGRKPAKDPFLRKEWYDVIAPNNFKSRKFCKTCVTKTTGLKVAADSLRGRVYEVNLADTQQDEGSCYRKMRLRCDEVDGRRCLTAFHGMDITNDRLRSLIKKWQSLIEAHVDVKTLDGNMIRMFCIAFTAKQANAVRHPGHPLTVYAQTSRIHLIRKRMMEIMRREAAASTLHDLVNKFIPETIAEDIRKACCGIYPITNVYIRKVKILKQSKFDVGKLFEQHQGAESEDTGKKVETPATEAPATQEAAPEAAPADKQ